MQLWIGSQLRITRTGKDSFLPYRGCQIIITYDLFEVAQTIPGYPQFSSMTIRILLSTLKSVDTPLSFKQPKSRATMILAGYSGQSNSIRDVSELLAVNINTHFCANLKLLFCNQNIFRIGAVDIVFQFYLMFAKTAGD